jgi:hypothetical protein
MRYTLMASARWTCTAGEQSFVQAAIAQRVGNAADDLEDAE